MADLYLGCCCLSGNLMYRLNHNHWMAFRLAQSLGSDNQTGLHLGNLVEVLKYKTEIKSELFH